MKITVLAAVNILVLSLPLAAQDLTYVQTTRVEFGGSMGAVMNMVPGLEDASRETVYLQGTRMRRDSEDRSTITDWATGEMIIINHAERTFVRMNWADIAEAMTQAMEGGFPTAEDAAEEADQPEPGPTFTTTFDVDQTDRTERIAGYQAKQVVMTMEVEGEMPPEGAEENELSQGAMAVVSELWLSTDFPEWAIMQEAREQMAEGFRAMAFGGERGESFGGMSMDPRIEVALRENQEALASLEGIGMKTIVSFVSVPFELELDVQTVLAQSDQELASGMGSLAAESAASAARGALGRLGSRFGRGRKEEPEEPEPAQSIFMRTTTEIGEVDNGALDDSVFAPPEGYTEQTSDMPIGAR